MSSSGRGAGMEYPGALSTGRGSFFRQGRKEVEKKSGQIVADDIKEELSLNFADTNMRSLVQRAFRWNSQADPLESVECNKIGTRRSRGTHYQGRFQAPLDYGGQRQ
jgi:hypothetical protein